MESESKGTFRVQEWHEEQFGETTGGPVLKKAHVVRSYAGDIEGRGVISYIFVYNRAEHADIYGVEQFTGSVDGMHGSFVMIHEGEFVNGKADIHQKIASKSGTGDLSTIEGSIHFEAGMAEEYPIILKHFESKGSHLWKKLRTKTGPDVKPLEDIT